MTPGNLTQERAIELARAAATDRPGDDLLGVSAGALGEKVGPLRDRQDLDPDRWVWRIDLGIRSGPKDAKWSRVILDYANGEVLLVMTCIE